MSAGNPPPVAVGAVGGSGTRVVARILREFGIATGTDLNKAGDNLWFALLFKRPQALVAPAAEIDALASLFYARMRGVAAPAGAARLIETLVAAPRPQHAADWLRRRAETLLAPVPAPGAAGWGWKAPITHVFVERLLARDPHLRYVHVMRSGLDMAFSANRNQLALWGPVFLGRIPEDGPADALAFWCAVHRRVQAIAARFPDRVLILDFDQLCREPQAQARALATFCRRNLPDAHLAAVAGGLEPPVSTGRFRRHELTGFNSEDVAYVASLGYEIG